MAAAFKPGDLVRLKSGGPIMTVYSLSTLNSTEAYCQWFKSGKLHGGNFPITSLKPASDDDVVDDD